MLDLVLSGINTIFKSWIPLVYRALTRTTWRVGLPLFMISVSISLILVSIRIIQVVIKGKT